MTLHRPFPGRPPAFRQREAPSFDAHLRAKLHFLERSERSLLMALRSTQLGHRRRRNICERLEAIELAIATAHSLLARLH
jgi:hypothetical protein